VAELILEPETHFPFHLRKWLSSLMLGSLQILPQEIFL
jgi:hypothetical protein